MKRTKGGVRAAGEKPQNNRAVLTLNLVLSDLLLSPELLWFTFLRAV